MEELTGTAGFFKVKVEHHIFIIAMVGFELENIDQLEGKVSLARNGDRCRNLLFAGFNVGNVYVTDFKSFEYYSFVGVEIVEKHHLIDVGDAEQKLIHKVAVLTYPKKT